MIIIIHVKLTINTTNMMYKTKLKLNNNKNDYSKN